MTKTKINYYFKHCFALKYTELLMFCGATMIIDN
jgi:hypothetical protein